MEPVEEWGKNHCHMLARITGATEDNRKEEATVSHFDGIIVGDKSPIHTRIQPYKRAAN